jgi:site-specific DNA recombinase
MKIAGQKSAVIYCRVSSIKQSTVGDGLKSQETRCREFARMKGYDVVEVFSDDVSGSRVHRPGMGAMLAYLRKRKTQGIVVIIDDVSRLARGLEAHLELRGSIASAGGILESPSIEFGEDSDSKLIENLLASVSQHSRQKNGEQTINRMRARVTNGYAVFQAPVGYEYKSVPGRGKMLKRVEPIATVVQEALEGFAYGRFETQADVMRFLTENPLFPKGPSGGILNHRVFQMLTNGVYAGYVEAPRWGITRRVGHHEPLISQQTFQRVQDRLNGTGYAPRQANLNEDFPLRGFVVCDDCETPLTACWSSGSHKRFPYYLCPKRGCASYGKSIRRADIEGEFEQLLGRVQPTETLFKVARKMLKDLWEHRLTQGATQAKALALELTKIDRQVEQFLERIVETNVPSVIAAYEDRVSRLEQQRLVIKDRIANSVAPKSTFDETVRTALEFLANPWNLWKSGRLEDRRAVLKLAFAERLRYARGEGFRTTKLSLPFNVLGSILGGENEMARPKRFELLPPRFVA